MPAVETVVQVPIPSSGATKKIDNRRVPNTDAPLGFADRQVAALGDDEGTCYTALVAPPAGTEAALPVRQVGPVAVSGTVATGGLTDAELRAAPVPVSGTVTTSGLTDAELRAVAVPVSSSTLASEATVAARFGVSTGLPSGAISVVGPSPLHTPAAGARIRLKWLHLASSQDNTAEVVATVKLGSTAIYVLPLGFPGAFSHSSVREGAPDAALTLTLSAAGQSVFANFDLEEFA